MNQKSSWVLFLGLCCCWLALSSPTFSQETKAEPAKTEAAASETKAATEEKPAETKQATEEKPAEPATTTAAPALTLEALKSTTDGYKVAMDTMWVMIAGFLVFFMNLGFGCVEAGMCRAKNCVNILSKNFIVFAVSTLGFWALGFGIMFGADEGPLAEYIGSKGLFFVKGVDNSPALGADYAGDYPALNWTGVPLAAKFFFQLVFAGTAATIVSGAVAERIKYLSFIMFSLLISIFIYPVVGHWIWGGGWLADKGFFDFAGSTQVHSIGGWCALTGILILGPRSGRYGADGKINAFPGHSMMAAFIGCLVLWFGWFGFNPGSTMAADPGAIAEIALTTNIGGAIATLTATATAWIMLGKPDVGMTLNGCLAGLVAVTAPCAYITNESAAIIGAIAGVLVVLAVGFFDKLKIDDPVGATSVHLVNGVFGTLCVGLFADPKIVAARIPGASWGGLLITGDPKQLMIQLQGIVATAAYVLVASTICWFVIKATMGLRVSPQEEFEGLDHGEHGNEAYHSFQFTPTK